MAVPWAWAVVSVNGSVQSASKASAMKDGRGLIFIINFNSILGWRKPPVMELNVIPAPKAQIIFAARLLRDPEEFHAPDAAGLDRQPRHPPVGVPLEAERGTGATELVARARLQRQPLCLHPAPQPQRLGALDCHPVRRFEFVAIIGPGKCSGLFRCVLRARASRRHWFLGGTLFGRR